MDDIREVDRFQLRLSRTPPDAGELEEGVGEPVHPLGSGEYVFQEATARDRIIAFGHQELRREGDRGEWSAQLVGRAGQKLLLSLLESAPLREVLGHDQHSVLATVTQVRHVLKFDTQEGLSSPHAGFSALPLPCAADDRFAQVEVLPGAGELSVLLAHAEHGPPRRVGEDHRAPRVATTPSERLSRMAPSVASFSASRPNDSSRLAAMELRVLARAPSSSPKPGSMRCDRWPRSIRRAPELRRSTLLESITASKYIRPPPMREARIAASKPLRRNGS